MEKILAKQVEDVVDLKSNQQIGGEKTFTNPTVFDKQNETHHIVIYEGFVYWVSDTAYIEQDGNYRIGITEGTLCMQEYLEGSWINL